MAIVNDNIRFIRTRNNLSQQKLADRTGVNRGNIDSYEKNTTPNLEFLTRIANEFGINLQMMLAERMTDYNYSQFESNEKGATTVNEPTQEYGLFKKSSFFKLMLQIKTEEDTIKRSELVDRAMTLVNILEDENHELQTELRELMKEISKIG